MNYSEFTNAIAKRAEKTAGEDGRVYINRVLKNNGTRLDGLVIMEKDHMMAPTIYIDDYYPKYKKGMSIDKIMDEILSSYYMNRDSFELNLDFFKSYEKMRHRIAFKIINHKKNKELLKQIPHKKFLDLAIVYYAVLSDNGGRIATALLHNTHLEAWNIDQKTLDEQASFNTPRLLRATIRPIEKVLDDYADKNGIKSFDTAGTDECDEYFPDLSKEFNHCGCMYVLTNSTGMNGAACLLYEKPLACFGRKIDQDFFVLPSSVHEVILVPKTENINKEDLSEMVRDINKTDVSADEILSDNVYEYDHLANELKM